MIFEYGEKEITYLKNKDQRLAKIIDRLGYIPREVDSDLFSAVVHHIIGQQISTKAQATIWQRLEKAVEQIDEQHILALGKKRLQALGITYRKAEYVLDFAEKVHSGKIDLAKLATKSDEQIIQELMTLKGIGRWTAEMILLFCLQRPDILSYDDLAIQRGLRMVYHHRQITKKLFAKYQRRYHPYGSVASLYLWAVANGKVEGMKDPAPAKKNKRRKSDG
ncbi:MAG: DNA-3-methyladenine glycosylase 2 family protein [Erysipelotrichaceae bacterium]|nr:DNA-3-methyladenine glycosylase 2 family protein [Erysipelotrichaceae bacterium]MDY5251227.1 DNA-3-methyladenine glycosylase 2 family protein [Erysipelotrichaceae bacterium]